MKDYGQKTSKYPNQEFLEDISPVDKLIDKIKKNDELGVVINHSPACTFLCAIGDNWPIKYVSENIHDILGYNLADFTSGRVNYVDVIYPNDLKRVTDEFKNVIKNGLTEYFQEYRVLDSNGKIRFVNSKTWVRCDENGKPYCLQGIFWDITDRKNYESILKENERKLRVIMENLPGMVYRCKNDYNWTMKFVSDGCFELLGYLSEDLIENKAVSYNDLIHPDDRELVRKVWNENLNKKEKVTVEYRIICKDNCLKWVWEQGQGIFSENGEVLALEGFVADITDRKITENALVESEKYNRTIVEVIPDLIIKTNRNGEYLDIITSSDAEVPVEKETVIGKTIREVLPENEVEKVLNAIEKSITENSVQSVEYLLQMPTGKRCFEARIISSKPDEVYALIRDIIERKQMESALKESEEKFKSIIQSSPNAMHFYRLINENTLIFTGANPSADKMFGIKHEYVIGKSIEEAFPGLKNTKLPELYKKVAKREIGNQFFETSHKKGTVTNYYSVRVFLTMDNNIAVGFSDITERKQMENALRMRNEELERFEKAVIGRELKMVELKKKIKELEKNCSSFKRGE